MKTLIPLLVLVLLPGCLVRHESQVEVRGDYIRPETLGRVTAGTTKAEVLSLLGEPTEKTPPGGTNEIWTWAYHEERSEEGSVLFLFSSRKTTERTGSVKVKFEGDRVLKAWRE